MDTRFWHYCIMISLLVINHYSTAKPYSLNEALAAELDQKQITETSSSTSPEKTAERFSLNTILKPTSTKSNIIFKESGNIFSRIKKLSPLKYRKKFEIKTPLKPKNFKRSPKFKFRRNNQSVKREINGNDQLNQKYIPLLKNIGMLFDNLLMSDESDSYEVKSRKYKRNRYHTIFSEERDGMECTCTPKSNYEHEKSKSPEKTVAVETPTIEVSIDPEDVAFVTTTSKTTDNTSISDFGGVGLYQNVSLLFPRDTVSSWRNDFGISERSGSSHNRSVEGNFTWNHGNSKHSTECGQNESLAKNSDEDSFNAPRNCTSGNGSHERKRRNGNNSGSRNLRFTSDKTDVTAENENISEEYGHVPQHKRQNKLDVGGDETKGTKSLSELIRKLRGFISEIEVNTSSDTLQSKKNYTESIVDVAYNNTSDKRFSDRSSSNTEEVKKIGPRNETMIVAKTSIGSDTNKSSVKTPPVLMIIDGYSVTRHKNGENKLSKKAIHLHS